MIMARCFCGWQGLYPEQKQWVKGKAICPNCRKPFTQMKCDGCSE